LCGNIILGNAGNLKCNAEGGERGRREGEGVDIQAE